MQTEPDTAEDKSYHRVEGWLPGGWGNTEVKGYDIPIIRSEDLMYSMVIIVNNTTVNKGFPCGSAGKESACNVGDLGSIPGLGRSPGERKSYPL